MLARRTADVIGSLGARAMVAFDGPDAAGKTALAGQVAQCVSRPMIRASIDGFHQPRDIRTQRGSLSPVGYYLDSFDHIALKRELLGPFASGQRMVTTSVYDHRQDQPSISGTEPVDDDAVLLFDGV